LDTPSYTADRHYLVIWFISETTDRISTKFRTGESALNLLIKFNII